MTTTTTTQLVSALPRFFALRAPDGKYLTLSERNGAASLSFTADSVSRLATHEVMYNRDIQEAAEKTAVFSSANGRFWQISDNGVIAPVKEGIPRATDVRCQFHVEVDPKAEALKIQSLGGKWFASGDVLSASSDKEVEIEYLDASNYALTFPEVVCFQGNNDGFVKIYWNEGKDWLQFSGSGKELESCHKVIPLVDGNVAVQNVKSNRYWRRDTNWIKADVDYLTQAQRDINCQFEPVRLSTTMVAFRSVANDRFVKRYSDYWDNYLNAQTDTTNDPTSHLRVTNALRKRSVFNIKYLTHLAETESTEPVIVGRGSVLNNGNRPADMTVSVKFNERVTQSRKWTDSHTFSLDRTTTVKAGIPEVVGVEGSIRLGFEKTFQTEIGKEHEEEYGIQSRYTVKGIAKGEEAIVNVEVTRSKATIPYTYQVIRTRLDGVDLPPEERIDGIFNSVTVVSARAIISQGEKPPKVVPANSVVVPTTSPIKEVIEGAEEVVGGAVDGFGEVTDDVFSMVSQPIHFFGK